jgi:hypothetical protein
MKKIELKGIMLLLLLLITQYNFGQVTANPTVDWTKIGNDINKDLEKGETERANKRIYYENLKNQSLINIYGATNTNDYNNCKSFALKQMFYNGQQEFIKTINGTYNELTSGRLNPNSYINKMNSYNSQFLNFANTLIMLSNRINEMVIRGKSLNDIEQKINLIYNSNMFFSIETYEIRLKLQNNQTKTLSNLVNEILNNLNTL